jgi:hypothetical protein
MSKSRRPDAISCQWRCVVSSKLWSGSQLLEDLCPARGHEVPVWHHLDRPGKVDHEPVDAVRDVPSMSRATTAP